MKRQIILIAIVVLALALILGLLRGFVTASAATVNGHPSSRSILAGSTAKFTVKARGSGLRYQWQYRSSSEGKWKNSKASGSKTKSLSVKATQERDGYQYRCKVTDSDGNAAYSNAATLCVVDIVTQPTSATVLVGSEAQFTLETSGMTTYQWQYSTDEGETWKDSGAASASTRTLCIEGSPDRSGYLYRCRIADGDGAVMYSDTVTLFVK